MSTPRPTARIRDSIPSADIARIDPCSPFLSRLISCLSLFIAPPPHSRSSASKTIQAFHSRSGAALLWSWLEAALCSHCAEFRLTSFLWNRLPWLVLLSAQQL